VTFHLNVEQLRKQAKERVRHDYGWTKLDQAGYANDGELARLMPAAGASTDLFAHGDGGTPLVAVLFWGHREVAELLGRQPLNRRLPPPRRGHQVVGVQVAAAALRSERLIRRSGCIAVARRRSSWRRRRTPAGRRPGAGS